MKKAISTVAALAMACMVLLSAGCGRTAATRVNYRTDGNLLTDGAGAARRIAHTTANHRRVANHTNAANRAGGVTNHAGGVDNHAGNAMNHTGNAANRGNAAHRENAARGNAAHRGSHTAAHAGNTANARHISLAQYDRINNGMTYREVRDVFGHEGVRSMRGGNEVYSWDGMKNANADFVFVNGRLTEKNHTGLM